MTLDIADLQRLHQNTVRLINKFSKFPGYKINMQKSLVFLYTHNEILEKEIKKAIPFTVASERINT